MASRFAGCSAMVGRRNDDPARRRGALCPDPERRARVRVVRWEQSSIKPLRAWVKAAGLGKGEFDLTGYWRRGADGNHLGIGAVSHAIKHVLRLPH